MNKSWYLLRYHYGLADRAIANLQALGVNCFSPCKKLSNKSSKKIGNGKEKPEHLFPPYVFIEFDPEIISFSSIKYTPGVNGFVRFGQQIKPVNEEVINALSSNNQTQTDIEKSWSCVINCQNKEQRAIIFLSMIEKISCGKDLIMNRVVNDIVPSHQGLDINSHLASGTL